jgi:hypothetical protein
VNHYDVKTGNLALFHDYPPKQPRSLVQVDVTHVVEVVPREALEIGAWLNVVGYVTELKDGQRSKHPSQAECLDVGVQAILIWSADGLKPGQYERALEMRRESLLEETSPSVG